MVDYNNLLSKQGVSFGQKFHSRKAHSILIDIYSLIIRKKEALQISCRKKTLQRLFLSPNNLRRVCLQASTAIDAGNMRSKECCTDRVTPSGGFWRGPSIKISSGLYSG